MTALTTADLTSATAEGQGTFDVLMRSVKKHLDEEFRKGAIKGPEYSQVYLGSLNLAMQTGLSFLLQKQKTGLEVDLLNKQLALADIGLQKATVELAMLTASQPKIQAEIDQLAAQTALVTQQKLNLIAEGLNIPKQGALLDSQVLIAAKQVEIATAELAIKQQQIDVAIAEVGIAEAKLVNIPKEGAQLDAQTLLIGQQKTNLVSENLAIIAKTTLTDKQVLNAVTEGTVLVAQECKLRAEFDLTTASTNKTTSEIALLAQKTATEKAQILSTGVDDNSVIGRQKGLYVAQTNGFTRDAEQKAAKALMDTWSVRRTTDEATVADGTNMLYDASIGRAVNKLLAGINA
jgi:hypothetical protein